MIAFHVLFQQFPRRGELPDGCSTTVQSMNPCSVSPVRIAIVDDHEIVRRGFRELLAREPGFDIAAGDASGEVLLQTLRDGGCDLVLLDISLAAAAASMSCAPYGGVSTHVGVLILSGFPEDRYALPMIRNGADGYLCKDCEPAELVAAISSVARGQRYISPRTAELLASEVSGESRSRTAPAVIGKGAAGVSSPGAGLDRIGHRRGAASEHQDHQHLSFARDGQDGALQ